MCIVLNCFKLLLCMWEFQKHRTVIVTHVSPSSSCLVALLWSIRVSSILAFSNLVVSICEPKDCVVWLGARRGQDEVILGSSTVIWHSCWKGCRMWCKPTTYRYDSVSAPTYSCISRTAFPYVALIHCIFKSSEMLLCAIFRCHWEVVVGCMVAGSWVAWVVTECRLWRRRPILLIAHCHIWEAVRRA